MSERRQSWRFLALSPVPRRKRRKESTITLLTWDTIRTSLELVQRSADVCPPLKSAVGAVCALCDLADASRSSSRIAASDANAEALAWRAFIILETILNSIDSNKPVPPHLRHSIEQFEQLLSEIRTAMEVLAKENRVLRVLRLRRNESQLTEFIARLDLTAQLFIVIIMFRVLTSLLDLIFFSALDRHHGIPDHLACTHRGHCADRRIRGETFQYAPPRRSQIPPIYGRFFGLTPILLDPFFGTRST
ncbi:hypothetical protein C8J57DRAFT_1714847 [Mycena rebaudengoi]|nr:hypothetical protein C8J57DRAFT_1714847 [Mycena rebaudengoi]